ncbi:hypothetical protein ABIE12_001747 [Serratia sp. 509]
MAIGFDGSSVLIENLSTSDRDNVEPQLQVLPEPLGSRSWMRLRIMLALVRSKM